LKGPARTWWQWALIVLFDAWCVFGLALAATTYAENNAKGGNILPAIVLGITLVAFVVLRVLLRTGAAKTMARAGVAPLLWTRHG
jgi:hypothetical protein